MLESEIRANFAKNIKELRLSRKMNQVQLGEKLSYSSKAISKWENGDVMPDVVTLKMIADFFDIKVDDLISNKHVVFRSHRRRNHMLITLSSALLAFLVAAIVFLILSSVHIEKSWLSFVVAIPASGVVFVIFSSLWFKRIHIMISVMYLIIGACILTVLLIPLYLWWAILIIGLLLIILDFVFFRIVFKEKMNNTF